MANLSLSFLGPFQVTLDGAPVTEFATDHTRALLSYLAVESDRPHRREALAGLLWPHRPEQAARHNLRQALSNIRRAIGDREATPSFLLITRQTVQFNQASDCQLDVIAFTALLETSKTHTHRRLEVCQPCIERLEQAAGLYRGDFLAGFTTVDSPSFEAWVLAQQEWLHRQMLTILRRLTRNYEQRGEVELAHRYAMRQLELEPWREEAHRRLMRLLALDGQRSAALAQYETCRQVLAEALGVEPSKETTILVAQIKAGELSHLAPKTPPHNLPTQLTSFVGRGAELALITERLGRLDHRLVTLVGPGGVGKTRLALRAAAHQVGLFQDGVYFVPLAAVEAPSLLIQSIAEAINLNFYEHAELTEQLLNHLRRKEMLLVLDNFEHLLTDPHSPLEQEVTGGGDLVLDILRKAPEIVILVTSREPLNCQAESVLTLHGLPFPKDDQDPTVAEYGAVQLFIDRANQAQMGFELLSENIPNVVRICQLVEGIPLAIELAAAWVGARSVRKIAAFIRENMDFLATTLRDVPPRHRSMRAVFAHSWQLLSYEEQVLLPQLAVFRGGFSLEAAIEVAEATSFLLNRLRDKSLLRQVDSQRFDMHELLRQFAAEHLEDRAPNQSDRSRSIQDRHSAFYLDFIAGQRSALYGQQPQNASASIRIELENIRQAWRWAVEKIKLAALEQSAATLARFYTLVGLTEEGKNVFENAAHRLQDEDRIGNLPGEGQRVLAQLLIELVHFLRFQRQLTQAVEIAQEAIRLALAVGDPRSEVRAHILWAYSEQHAGDVDASLKRLNQALIRAREEHFRDLEGDILILIGKSWRLLGNYARSDNCYQPALAIQRELGNRSQEQNVLLYLGTNRIEQRDLHCWSYLFAGGAGSGRGGW